jgi:hypothetical protein
VASITAFPSKKTAIILLKSSNRVLRGGFWQEIFDRE